MMSDKCPRCGADQLQIAELEKRVAELEVPEYWRGRVEGAPPTATEVELAKDTQTEALLAARERIAELEKRIAELLRRLREEDD